MTSEFTLKLMLWQSLGKRSYLAILTFPTRVKKAKRKAALPAGKTAYLARLCIIQPITSEERGSKHLARGALGPLARGFGSFSPRAPQTVRTERRLVWRTIACPPKDQPRSWLRLLEQGPESQSASLVCWGGVSSVMGSSDLGAHSFVPSGHKVISIKAHCLEGLNDRLLGWRAFQSTEAGA